MKTVIIDNYDSFTYNLSQILQELNTEVTVLRNDMFQLPELGFYDKIVLSPGPGIPKEAGLLLDVIRYYAGRKPILGICLGEQAIGETFGASLINLPIVFHGIQSNIEIITDDYLFHRLPRQIPAGRYHSWIVDQTTLPECLETLAISKEGYIMALKHRTYDIRGVQFHPESILTPNGKTIIQNWLEH